MTTYYLKLAFISIFAVLVVSVGTFRNSTVNAAVPLAPEDVAATYKAKCAMCHTAAAAKFFDPAKTDEELSDSILKGKKTDKPPAMPAYGEKGITPEVAKDLVAHMRALKSAAK